MSPADLSVERLTEERVQEAWPVLLMAAAELSPDWWESEAKALIGRGGGILVGRTRGDLVHGLATYEYVSRPSAGRLLLVGRLITFELNRKEPVKAALRDCLELLAMMNDCILIEPDRQGLRQGRSGPVN